eukprot:PITA_12027
MATLRSSRQGLWLKGSQYTSICSLISIAAEMGWQIHQMDVKTTFLNGVIEEEVYAEQSQGFEQMGFTNSDADPNLYYIVVGDDLLILVLYVDDLFITGAETLISGYCRPKSIPMIINWKKLHASDSSLVDPTLYRHLIGSLMYLVNTRPDICFAVNTLCQFMVETRRVHWVDYDLDYRWGDGVRLAGYTDADWAGCASDRKSTSGCCFGLGLAVVSWFSRKKKSVALSSFEAKYMAASQGSCEAIWLRKLLYGLFDQELRPMVIHCDNQSCIKLTENLVFLYRSKHIDIRYHFIRDYVQKGAVKLEYISTNEQVADVLTESLPRGKHVHFRGKMGVVRNTFLGKRECDL